MSRKRSSKVLDLDDPVEAQSFDYPDSLVSSAKGNFDSSPTKATKRYVRPLKRRPRAIPMERETETETGGEEDWGHPTTPAPVVGPWEAFDDFGLASSSGTDLADDAAAVILGANSAVGFSDNDVASYLDAVESFAAGFYQVGESIFAVEGWDTQRCQATAGWYHLQHLIINSELHVACTCPQAVRNFCIHQTFFKEYDVERLLQGRTLRVDSTDAVLYFRQQVPNVNEFVTMFSVRSFSSSQLKGRAIVTHTGRAYSAGLWRCSKDPNSKTICVHVQACFKILEELTTTPEGDLDEVLEGAETAQALASITRKEAVSHLPVLPPASISLKSDPQLYPRPPPFRSPPSVTIALDPQASCPCPSGRTFHNPSDPTVVRQCRIFALHTVFHAQIELQRCPTCPRNRRRYIGPDLRTQGLFNYNNSILVSHELLDEYTISFVTSETPFTAFVAVVAHRYSVSGAVFMGEDLFRSVWFSYAGQMALEDDMTCVRCGLSPETVIWDGITLAFGRKHVSSTLTPPTEHSPQSIIRSNVKRLPKQQLIPDTRLRTKLRQVLKGPKLDESLSDEGSDTEPPNSDQDKEHRHRQSQHMLEHLNRVDDVYEKLNIECSALATLFRETFGAVAILNKKAVPAPYRNLFRQIAAEESVLQMINGSSLEDLGLFLSNPCRAQVTKLVTIPALYQVLQSDSDIEPLIPVARWLHEKASRTLKGLSVETLRLDDPKSKLSSEDPASDWKLVNWMLLQLTPNTAPTTVSTS
ncbi:hypothetical protein H1R20_g1991, partial [Candolleomyces eurysporus]